MNIKHSASHRLRAGRWSATGQYYLVTTVTAGRKPIFSDFYLARMLIQTIRQDALKGFHKTLCYVVMPDHLHWLVELRQGTLSQLVGRIKSLSAKRHGGRTWQKGFHDHALRKEEDVLGVARYIVANPIRAGLVTRAGDYPHWDAIWLCSE
ncbi:REP-associated tyrosine transposase [Pseudomonas sp. CNPSo 3701]|uniref:REP-associated tyrosine transposase n=1 Tax=Pseudomonas sp. CNPSo 3701 TaxID=3027943 RepID=UPI00236481DF|nr:transposase [Pseudomonas sp. CNPSo 3701]MDD1508270.1 transposase [Pseudomonas sp. CNPSo 3701]